MSDPSRVDSPASGPFTPMEIDNNSTHEPTQTHPNHDYQSIPLNATIKQEPIAPTTPAPTAASASVSAPPTPAPVTPVAASSPAVAVAASSPAIAPAQPPLPPPSALSSSSAPAPSPAPVGAAAASSSSSSSSIEAIVPTPMDHSRLDVETDGREKNLAEFLAMMDNYTPIIPDAVTDYYLSRTGFDCDDVRIKRLLALAAQKFVADIATDAFQYCKVRQSGNRRTGKERKTVLTMEDLSTALAEYGVNVKKPDYYS
ncbi:transcription initiation factor TFIID 23-30kDa subunit-domain-containing protein [Phycomyces blakesleeanus]